MKRIVLFFMILSIFSAVRGEKITQLADLGRPQMIDVEEGRLYVTEGVNIHIYSLKDFSLVKKFGKAGEGPREFKINPVGGIGQLVIAAYEGKLCVNSDTKLSYFSLDGEFIKEIKIPPFQVYFPVKDKFVASGTSEGEDQQIYLNIGLYDAGLKMIKELYRSDMAIGFSASFDFPINNFSYPVYKDRVYVVAGKEGFVIDIFDLQGDRLKRIQKKYTPLKVTESYRQQIMQWFQKSSQYKQFYELLKERITFKSHFGAVQNMMVENDRIYVFTFQKKDDLTELIIMDLKGEELARKYVPLTGIPGNMLEMPAYTIDNHYYYILIENEDEEVWELHRISLK